MIVKNKFSIISFYKFINIKNTLKLKEELIERCEKFDIKGIILIANEGINAGVSGGKKNILNFINNYLTNLNINLEEIKFSYSDRHAYRRLKVKIKNEILTTRDPNANPHISIGKYIEAKNWDSFISEPDVILVDTRNYYETSLGSFANSTNPKAKNFSDILKWIDETLIPNVKKNPNKKIAMFCTGGIRCEKASAYIKSKGISDVSQLKGGILKYFETTNSNNWNGQCFVFDNRVSLNTKLKKGSYDVCHACRMPIQKEEKESKKYIKGISCPNCYSTKSEKQLNRYKSRQKQMELAKIKNIDHIKNPNDKKIV